MDEKRPTINTEQIMKEQQNLLECFSGKKRGTFQTLFRFYKGHFKNLFLASFFFCVKVSPTWIIPIITANVIDIVTEKPDNALQLFIINGIVILIFLLQNIPTNTLFISFLSKVQRSIEAGLRGAMVRKLQQLSVTFHKGLESGKIQSKVMRDVEAIENFTTQLFTTGMSIITNMAVSLVIVISKSVTVFLMFLVCIPFAVLIRNIFAKKMQERNHDFRAEMENTSANVLEMEDLIPVTRAHSLERNEIKKMTKSVTKVAESGYKMDRINGIFGAVSWVTFNIFQIVCLFFTGSLALKGEISVGDVTLYQSYFTSLVGQVSNIIAILPIITKGTESINSIGEILSSHDVEDNHNKIKMKDLEGKYEFCDVHFSYDEQTPVLSGLNLTVNPGETIALVGESGSGKTTILNLVIGFDKATKGTVKIDGIDVNDIDMRSCRNFISVVPQNSILFSGSIRENITYGCPYVTDEMLDYAIRAAKLEDVIAMFPDGLETQVGEHGSKLSGGQRQRISIARAIIRNPKVIIFDEATSALDALTESKIQEAIEHLTSNCTTFIVAHRLSTIRNADKIAFIAKGRCVEYGTYEELMALKGEFYHLKQLQS